MSGSDGSFQKCPAHCSFSGKSRQPAEGPPLKDERVPEPEMHKGLFTLHKGTSGGGGALPGRHLPAGPDGNSTGIQRHWGCRHVPQQVDWGARAGGPKGPERPGGFHQRTMWLHPRAWKCGPDRGGAGKDGRGRAGPSCADRPGGWCQPDGWTPMCPGLTFTQGGREGLPEGLRKGGEEIGDERRRERREEVLREQETLVV